MANTDTNADCLLFCPGLFSSSFFAYFSFFNLSLSLSAPLCTQCAFSQLTLAFRCDQYTLSQRLQAEEHARNKAEENLQLELQRGKEAIEVTGQLQKVNDVAAGVTTQGQRGNDGGNYSRGNVATEVTTQGQRGSGGH